MNVIHLAADKHPPDCSSIVMNVNFCQWTNVGLLLI